MKNKALRIVIWVVFILCCMVFGAIFSMVPYSWGERDGSGVLLWVFTIIPFLSFLLLALLYAIFGNVEKPYVSVFVSSAVIFFLNFLVPYVFVRFDYFKEIDVPAWLWILYVSSPFIYGCLYYIMFKYVGGPKTDNSARKDLDNQIMSQQNPSQL